MIRDIPFHGIASGKLRRYFSWQNFIDPFKVTFGVLQALVLCLRESPDVVFSKGGFVAVPVVVAAWILRIPVICHESDVTPGLANRLCLPFSQLICLNFEESKRYVPAGKSTVTGTPVRRALIDGDAENGRTFLGFTGDKPVLLVFGGSNGRTFLGFTGGKPVLLVFGGSLGAGSINAAVREVLQGLLERFDIVHIAGEGNVDASLDAPGYVQKTFLQDEFGDVMAAATIVVSRAGANSIYELLYLRKPHLLIPLSAAVSRGDQLENAEAFREAGFSHVLAEEDLSGEKLLQALDALLASVDVIANNLENFERRDSVARIRELIVERSKN